MDGPSLPRFTQPIARLSVHCKVVGAGIANVVATGIENRNHLDSITGGGLAESQ